MIRNALRYFKRTPYQSLAAILIMSLTFFIIGVFTVTATGLEVILRFLETRPQVTAFLKDDLKPQEIELLKAKLEATGQVGKVKYVSKEDALTIYKNEHKDNPLLLEMVTAKILPASLEISAINLPSLSGIAETLKGETIIEDVVFQKDDVSVLISWLDTLRKFGIFLVVFLIIISLLTVLVVISLKISSRREEIEILSLVGATGNYIRFPFVIEGIIYGLISGFVSWLATYLLLLYSTPFLITFLAGIPIFPIPIVFTVGFLAGLLFLGVLVGGTGSFWATRRFLKIGK